MNGFGGTSLALLVAVAAVGRVRGDVQTSTPCSLSFYRYLFNLPGEQIRPNVPEGTYVFGKRVGPATPEGQASDFRPSVLKPAASYEAPQYLPPKPAATTTTTTTTTTSTTTTARPSTPAPLYIPPGPYYPGEASDAVPVSRPACDRPAHGTRPDNGLVPPYRSGPVPSASRPQPTYRQTVAFAGDNDVVGRPRYPVPTPPPRFLRPYGGPVAPAPVASAAPEPAVETRQNEIVVVTPDADAPRYKPAECGRERQPPGVESLAVPSADYGVVSAPSPSAGYSYDKPGRPLPYPSDGGYAYPKPSPSFEYPGAGPYAAQALFESESSRSSAAGGGTEDGDLVVLKV